MLRKSCIEFGGVVGRPESTRTDSFFHVKYDSQGRGASTGSDDNSGQALFYRPANSGQYAVAVAQTLRRHLHRRTLPAAAAQAASGVAERSPMRRGRKPYLPNGLTTAAHQRTLDSRRHRAIDGCVAAVPPPAETNYFFARSAARQRYQLATVR